MNEEEEWDRIIGYLEEALNNVRIAMRLQEAHDVLRRALTVAYLRYAECIVRSAKLQSVLPSSEPPAQVDGGEPAPTNSGSRRRAHSDRSPSAPGAE